MLNFVRLREVDVPTPTPRISISTLTSPPISDKIQQNGGHGIRNINKASYLRPPRFWKVLCSIEFTILIFADTFKTHSYRNVCIYVRGVILNCGQIVSYVTSVFVVMEEGHLVFLNERFIKRGAYVTIRLKWKVTQKSQNCLPACPFCSGKPWSKKIK